MAKNINFAKINTDFRERVMREIRERKIKMKSPLTILGEKLGLESALIVSVLFGSFFGSAIFYFIKRSGLIKFLSFGIPGARVILNSLPYDYIGLFLFALICAVFFANKLQMFTGRCTHTEAFSVYFFLVALFLGIFFGTANTGRFLKNWVSTNISKNRAVYGQIENVSGSNIILKTESGNVNTIFSEKPSNLCVNVKEGEFLRAVGFWDADKEGIFHAQALRCDED